MIKNFFKRIWEESSFTARSRLALTMVAAVAALSSILPFPAASNFFGAALVAIGGLVAAWSKVEPKYFHASQQAMPANGVAKDLKAPTPGEEALAELRLIRREHNGLALIAVGGAIIAGSALHSLVSSWVSPEPVPPHEHATSQAAFHRER